MRSLGVVGRSRRMISNLYLLHGAVSFLGEAVSRTGRCDHLTAALVAIRFRIRDSTLEPKHLRQAEEHRQVLAPTEDAEDALM